jgi:sigma-B regulation protein RsbU (phosphoserine phosphatase)
MLTALNQDPEADPQIILKNTMDRINDFVAGEEQFDDITMLCLKYNG